VAGEEDKVERRAYSARELAQRWGVSVSLVKALIASGQLRSFRVRRRVLIPTSSIEEFERGIRREGESA
jgi:excisionase family DNA binding protein